MEARNERRFTKICFREHYQSQKIKGRIHGFWLLCSRGCAILTKKKKKKEVALYQKFYKGTIEDIGTGLVIKEESPWETSNANMRVRHKYTYPHIIINPLYALVVEILSL